MYIQYVGFDAARSSRIYTFHVIDAPHEDREFTVSVQSEEFQAARLKLQDGPAICFARLKQELQGETEGVHAEAHLSIEEKDVQEYMERHYPRTPFAHKRAPHRWVERNQADERSSSDTESGAPGSAAAPSSLRRRPL